MSTAFGAAEGEFMKIYDRAVSLRGEAAVIRTLREKYKLESIGGLNLLQSTIPGESP